MAWHTLIVNAHQAIRGKYPDEESAEQAVIYATKLVTEAQTLISRTGLTPAILESLELHSRGLKCGLCVHAGHTGGVTRRGGRSASPVAL